MGVLFPVGSESNPRSSVNKYEHHRRYCYTGEGGDWDCSLVSGNSAGTEGSVAAGNLVRNGEWEDALLSDSLPERLLHGPHSASAGDSSPKGTCISAGHGSA